MNDRAAVQKKLEETGRLIHSAIKESRDAVINVRDRRAANDPDRNKRDVVIEITVSDRKATDQD